MQASRTSLWTQWRSGGGRLAAVVVVVVVAVAVTVAVAAVAVAVALAVALAVVVVAVQRRRPRVAQQSGSELPPSGRQRWWREPNS